jgi:hypothetical protein
MSELKPTEEMIFSGIKKSFGSWHTETHTLTLLTLKIVNMPDEFLEQERNRSWYAPLL